MYSHFALAVPFLVVSLQPTLSAAFSWQLTAPPKQCSNLAISIVGSDGQPPYRVLVIPSSPTPLANNVEVRVIIDQAFDGDSTRISFPINYPANSHFVAVVSDANGFGTGGASVETMVGNSGDSSCFDPTKSVSPLFDYGVGKDNQLMQCQSTFVWWDSSKSQGTVSFVGVIPGGQSFKLPESNISTNPSLGTELTWTPNIQGIGTGGSGQFTVQSSGDTTCLNSRSPSSTPGVAAGSLQTTTSTSRTSASSTTGVSASKTLGTGTGKTSGTGTGNTAGVSANKALGTGTGNTAGASPSTTGASSTSSNAAGPSSDTTNNRGGLNVAVIVPAAVGGGVGIFIVIVLIVGCLRKCGESRPTRPLLSYIRQANSIAKDPEDALVHYLPDSPEPPTFLEVGTYNHQYAYSSGLPQTTEQMSVISGSGGGGSEVYDTSSQRGSRHLEPPPSSSQGARPPTRMMSVRSGGGDYNMSRRRTGSRRGAPLVTSSTLGPPYMTQEDMIPEEPPPTFTPNP